MKYSFVLPLLSLASSVLSAPAVVTETSVVLVTANNGQPTSSTIEQAASSATPQVGHVYEVVVSELVEVSGDHTQTSTTTFTRTASKPTSTGGNAAPSSSQTAQQESTLSQADRAVVSTIDDVSSTSQQQPTPSSTKQTTTLQPSSTSQEQTSTSSTSTQASSTTSQSSTPSQGTDSSFASEILKAHNDKRSQDGASPLSWSKKLEQYAQDYADKYDCSGGLTHSGGPYGENLGLGYSTSGVVDAWYGEKSDYNSNSPSASHFTQVVWKSTTQLGCAKKECGSYWGQYTVCSYDPAGNVAGGYAQNVQ
ncbi:unnamed protein product [Wickerhamomyces anomalus]